MSGQEAGAGPHTLTEALERAAERNPERVLLECDDREITVAQFEDESARVAGGLVDRGIEPGDRVAIMMRNVPEFVSAWFGILRARAIEVPIHCAYKGPQLQHVLSESAPRVLICDREFAGRLKELELPSIERVVIRETGGEEVSVPDLPWPLDGFAELAGSEEPAPGVERNGRAISCVLYTSGTTGPSKGVVLSHAANLCLANAVIGLMDYGPDDVLYTAFPLFHVNAKYTSVLTALLCGGRLVLDEQFSASRFWDRMRDRGVTAFNYMGSMLTILDKQPPREDDSDHRVSRSYGAACPASLWESFEERFGLELREHYGMTEIGVATMNTATERRVGSIGKAAAHLEIQISDTEGRAQPDGESGEITVRPREPGGIFDFYWDRLDATAEAFRDLWFHTGDIGWRDEEGFFHYLDRTKDCIRRRGENVSSFEVESAVNTHPQVLESAAFGVPSELGEEEVAIVVVLQGGADPGAEALLDHCQHRLPYFAVPRFVVFRDEIPKNASLRIQKFVLREQGLPDDAFDVQEAGYVVRR